LFVSHNADDAAQYLVSCGIRYRIAPLKSQSGRIEIRSVANVVKGINFARVGVEEPVVITPMESASAYALVFPRAGSTTLSLGRNEIDLVRPNAAIVDPQRVVSIRRSARSENYGVHIERHILVARLSDLIGAAVTRRLEFAPQFDRSLGAVEGLRAFLDKFDQTAILPALVHAPSSAARLSELLADLLLELLPHNYQEALRRTPKLIAPKHVKRAIDHIKAYAAPSLATKDLVRVSGVSLRALQYGFRKFLGVTISEYERSIRLEHARRELESNPDEPIGVIARRWGFTNVTRFSSEFEFAFGISPVALRAKHRRV
jgi:AraC-like DNA-binding protein